MFAEICRRSCLRLQPFQPRARALQQKQFQAQPCRRSRWVAPNLCGIRDRLTGLTETGLHPSDTTVTKAELTATNETPRGDVAVTTDLDHRRFSVSRRAMHSNSAPFASRHGAYTGSAGSGPSPLCLAASLRVQKPPFAELFRREIKTPIREAEPGFFCDEFDCCTCEENGHSQRFRVQRADRSRLALTGIDNTRSSAPQKTSECAGPVAAEHIGSSRLARCKADGVPLPIACFCHE